MSDPNAPRWDGGAGFYEVWYLTLTDRASGVGLWIRYTMLAPKDGEPTCALWGLAMDPAASAPTGGKDTYPISAWRVRADPFEVRVGDAALDDRSARGTVGDVSWDLRWSAPGGAYAHVHPLLERARIAKTVLALPHADLAVDGTVRIGGRELRLEGTRAGQAHLWGTKHAGRWAWAHCNDFEGLDGRPSPGAFVDGVTVWVPRFGRTVGPSTPVVARVDGSDLLSVAPHRVLGNPSRATLTGWSFEARARGGRRLVAEVDAPRELLAGVTYEDPDGEKAYCYNTEVATMRLQVWSGDRLADTLVAPGRCHFEYAQRDPVPGVPLLTT
jgi:hypothetical protein